MRAILEYELYERISKHRHEMTDSDLLPILSQLLNVLGCGMVVVLLVSRPRR